MGAVEHYEYEGKALIRVPTNPTLIQRILYSAGIKSANDRYFASLHHGQLESRIREHYGSCAVEQKTFRDETFVAASSEGIEEKLGNVHHEPTADGLKVSYDGKIIDLEVKADHTEGKQAETEFSGFLSLMRNYAQLLSHAQAKNERARYKFRIREVTSDGSTRYVLTAKYKHKIGFFERNREYQFFVNSKEDAQAFLEELGWTQRVGKKTKHSNILRTNGLKYEFNTIQELGGAMFLEIEQMGEELKQAAVLTNIQDAFRVVGIDPLLRLGKGGFMVKKGYQTMIGRWQRAGDM